MSKLAIIELGHPVTRKDIRWMMRQRPEKWGIAESGFEANGGDDDESCSRCVHFFVRPKDSLGRCELVRLPDDGSIRATDWCRLFSPNGIDYPALNPEPKA